MGFPGAYREGSTLREMLSFLSVMFWVKPGVGGWSEDN